MKAKKKNAPQQRSQTHVRDLQRQQWLIVFNKRGEKRFPWRPDTAQICLMHSAHEDLFLDVSLDLMRGDSPWWYRSKRRMAN